MNFEIVVCYPPKPGAAMLLKYAAANCCRLVLQATQQRGLWWRTAWIRLGRCHRRPFLRFVLVRRNNDAVVCRYSQLLLVAAPLLQLGTSRCSGHVASHMSKQRARKGSRAFQYASLGLATAQAISFTQPSSSTTFNMMSADTLQLLTSKLL
jgi:hypothetical protein